MADSLWNALNLGDNPNYLRTRRSESQLRHRAAATATTLPHWRRCAFTLVEVAVVILVIALIAGAILVGREMFHAMEVRATIGQVEEYNAAVNTFRLKYHCLPGDCGDAAALGFAPGSEGNGDGLIGPCNRSPGCNWFNLTYASAVEPEFLVFWHHLSAAGFIRFNSAPFAELLTQSGAEIAGIGSPRATLTGARGRGNLPGGWSVFAEVLHEYPEPEFSPGHSLVLGMLALPVGGGNNGSHWPADVQAIDAKVDDGLPLSGIARAWVVTTPLPSGHIEHRVSPGFGPGGPSDPHCLNAAANPIQYNVRATPQGYTPNKVCGLAIRSSF